MMIKVQKLKLYVKADDKNEVNRVYTFLRDYQYMQYKILNCISGALYSAFYDCGMDLKSDEFKKKKKEISLRNYPVYDALDIKSVPCTGDLPSTCNRKVMDDFNTAVKNGLCKGERSSVNYKRTFPVITRGRNLKFYSEYSSHDELQEASHKPDFNVYIKWINKCEFKVASGNTYKTSTKILRQNLVNILTDPENYQIKQSSITINKKKEIILNLNVDFPDKSTQIEENKRMGVALGIHAPIIATCIDNDTNNFKSYPVGNMMEIEDIRIKLQEKYKKKVEECKYTRSGKGRKKKMKHAYNSKISEKNAVTTINHKLSRELVNIAVENHVSTILLHDLSSLKTSSVSEISILRSWSYFQLYNFITYKAGEYGIVVKYTAEPELFNTCCCCGHKKEMKQILDDFMIKKEDKAENLAIFYKKLSLYENKLFTCPECSSKYLYSENYSINIAKSKKIDVKNKKTK